MTWSPRILSTDSTEVDPIYAAIAAHRRFGEAAKEIGKTEPPQGHPDLEDWEERNESACDAEAESALELLKTTPTTKAGLLAFADYLPRARIILECPENRERAVFALIRAIRVHVRS